MVFFVHTQWDIEHYEAALSPMFFLYYSTESLHLWLVLNFILKKRRKETFHMLTRILLWYFCFVH